MLVFNDYETWIDEANALISSIYPLDPAVSFPPRPIFRPNWRLAFSYIFWYCPFLRGDDKKELPFELMKTVPGCLIWSYYSILQCSMLTLIVLWPINFHFSTRWLCLVAFPIDECHRWGTSQITTGHFSLVYRDVVLGHLWYFMKRHWISHWFPWMMYHVLVVLFPLLNRSLALAGCGGPSASSVRYLMTWRSHLCASSNDAFLGHLWCNENTFD